MRRLIALLAGAAALPLAAAGAQRAAAVDPGMSRAQVVAALGEPLAVSQFGGFTYLFYQNGCESRCGMHDLVTLDSDKVVDAIFRAPGRTYTGASSSPQMISAVAAAHPSAAAAPTRHPAPPPQTPKKPAKR